MLFQKQVLPKKIVLKNFLKFKGNHLYWSFFLIMFQAEDTGHRSFPMRFVNILRASFWLNTAGHLPLPFANFPCSETWSSSYKCLNSRPGDSRWSPRPFFETKSQQLCHKCSRKREKVKLMIKLNLTPLQGHNNQFQGVTTLLNTNDTFWCGIFTKKLLFYRLAILRIICVADVFALKI